MQRDLYSHGHTSQNVKTSNDNLIYRYHGIVRRMNELNIELAELSLEKSRLGKVIDSQNGPNRGGLTSDARISFAQLDEDSEIMCRKLQRLKQEVTSKRRNNEMLLKDISDMKSKLKTRSTPVHDFSKIMPAYGWSTFPNKAEILTNSYCRKSEPFEKSSGTIKFTGHNQSRWRNAELYHLGNARNQWESYHRPLNSFLGISQLGLSQSESRIPESSLNYIKRKDGDTLAKKFLGLHRLY